MPSESPPAVAVAFTLPPRPSTVPPMPTVTQESLIEGPPGDSGDSEGVVTTKNQRKISIIEEIRRSESIDNCNPASIETRISIDSNQSTSQQLAPPPPPPDKKTLGVLLDQERYLPIANVVRLMKGMMDPSAKLAKDAKECVQECVSEFISFIASEAAEICNQTRKKTIGADDLLTAMEACGFDNYVEPLRIFLQKFRQAKKMSGPPHHTHPNYVRPIQYALDPPVLPLFYETEHGRKCTETEDPRAKNLIMQNSDYLTQQQHHYQLPGTEDLSKGGGAAGSGYIDDWNLGGPSTSSAGIPPPGTTVILTGRSGDQLDEDEEEILEGGGGRLTQDEDGNIYEEVQLDSVSMHDYHQSNGHHLSHSHHHHNPHNPHHQLMDEMGEVDEEIDEIGGGDGDEEDDDQMGAIALEQQQQMQIYIDPKSKQHYAAKETPNGMELYPLIIQNTPLHLENVTGPSQFIMNMEDGPSGHIMIPDDSMPSTSSAHHHHYSHHQNSPSTSSSSSRQNHQNPPSRHLENQMRPPTTTTNKRRKPNYMSQETMNFSQIGGEGDDVTSVRQHLTGNKKTPAKRRRH